MAFAEQGKINIPVNNKTVKTEDLCNTFYDLYLHVFEFVGA